MSGLAIPGRFSVVEVSEDGTNFENFGGVVDDSMDETIGENECTSHDSNGVREYLPGFSDGTVDVTARWLDGDPGQRIVLLAKESKTSFTVRFYMEKDPGSGKFYWEALGFATSISKSAPLDDTAGMTATLRLSGIQQLTQ